MKLLLSFLLFMYFTTISPHRLECEFDENDEIFDFGSYSFTYSFEYIGCWADRRNRALVDRFSCGRLGVDWSLWGSNATAFFATKIEICSKYAAHNLYDWFAVQYWDECWGGFDADVRYNMHWDAVNRTSSGEKRGCRPRHINVTTTYCEPGYGSIGTPWTNAVYKIACEEIPILVPPGDDCACDNCSDVFGRLVSNLATDFNVSESDVQTLCFVRDSFANFSAAVNVKTVYLTWDVRWEVELKKECPGTILAVGLLDKLGVAQISPLKDYIVAGNVTGMSLAIGDIASGSVYGTTLGIIREYVDLNCCCCYCSCPP